MVIAVPTACGRAPGGPLGVDPMCHRPLDPSNNLLRVYFQNSASRSRASTLGSLITVLCLYQLRKLQGSGQGAGLYAWAPSAYARCVSAETGGLTGVGNARMSTSRNSLVRG
jgi:hypothetical protein